MRRLIYGLFAVAMLAAVGCEKEVSHENQYYVLWFSTTVVDEAGEPIQGIKAAPVDGEFVGRTGYSNYEGKISARAYLTPRNEWAVCFEDVDGEANGGVYASTTITINPKAPEKPDEWGFVGNDAVCIEKVVLKKSNN